MAQRGAIWTNKTITMAYAEITLDDARDTAQGQEIQLKGGDYGSVGAGPQRTPHGDLGQR